MVLIPMPIYDLVSMTSIFPMTDLILSLILKLINKGDEGKSFYSIQQYENWKEGCKDSSNWKIRYYKGLATHNPQEGREYFQNIKEHTKDFIWKVGDDKAIDVAFGSKNASARKTWISTDFEYGDHETYLNANPTSYADFINNELILYARADIQRSIPSLVDGLTKVRRKILFGFLVNKDPRTKPIEHLAGSVSLLTCYHHGVDSMSEAMIKMAQEYVGSNNINLLTPLGTLDTDKTYGKGKDHYATDRYVQVELNSITRHIFLKEDDKFLNYLNEDGETVEPYCYQPIIPMILVNGAEGIATGWSSRIPKYNPKGIIKNIKNWLMGKPFNDMIPCYKGFLGTIQEDPNNKGSFLVKGIVTIIDKTTFLIKEIPFTKSKKDFKEFLRSLTEGPHGKTRQIKSFEEDENGDFKIHLIEPFQPKKPKKSQEIEISIIEEFGLQTSISIKNMHLLDKDMKIKKYDTVDAILKEFLEYRLSCYEAKKSDMVTQLKRDRKSLYHKITYVELWATDPAMKEREKWLSIFKKTLLEKKKQKKKQNFIGRRRRRRRIQLSPVYAC